MILNYSYISCSRITWQFPETQATSHDHLSPEFRRQVSEHPLSFGPSCKRPGCRDRPSGARRYRILSGSRIQRGDAPAPIPRAPEQLDCSRSSLFPVLCRTRTPSGGMVSAEVEVGDLTVSDSFRQPEINQLLFLELSHVSWDFVKATAAHRMRFYVADSLLNNPRLQWRRPGAEFGGVGNFFRGIRFLNDCFSKKNFHFHGRNF